MNEGRRYLDVHGMFSIDNDTVLLNIKWNYMKSILKLRSPLANTDTQRASSIIVKTVICVERYY